MFGVERGGRLNLVNPGKQFGKPLGECSSRRTERLCKFNGRASRTERAQQVEQRRLGERAILLEAVTLHDGHTVLRGHRLNFGDEA